MVKESEQGPVVRARGGDQGRFKPAVDPAKLFDKLPPNAPEAEMSLLGSLILDPRVTAEVIALVPTGDYFYREAHAVVFEAIKRVYDQHNSGDLVQLTEALRDSDALEAVGGTDYLVTLAESAPSAANAVYYARIVREKAQLRRLISTAGEILYNAYHAGEMGEGEAGGARAVLDCAERDIMKIAEQSSTLDDKSLAVLLQETMELLIANEGRSLTGLDTGFYDLNDMTSGLQDGEMVIVAGRPSMGKTAFALNIAEQIAMGGRPHAEDGPATPVGFFSMEMSRHSVVQRLLCARAGVDSHRFRTNRLHSDEFQRLIDTAAELSELPLHIDDTPGLTILLLRAKARRMVQQHGVKCIVVDYMQLMSAPSASRDGRQQEVSTISRGVKALARELNVPVICLAQLNRGAEQREGHRPRMADLRESGSIEQDADVILLLHREEYYHRGEPAWDPNHPDFDIENQDKIGLAEVIIAKQRNGPTGTVKLTWDDRTTRFRNHASPGRHAGGSAPSAAPSAPKQSDYPAAGGSSFRGRQATGPEQGFRDGGGPDTPFQADDDLPI